METKLHWQKKWYESQYQLFLGNEQIGEISPIAFSSKTIACIDGNKYIFRPSGILLNKVHILKAGTQDHLGNIRFSRFGTRASIILDIGEAYNLRCANILTLKWKIYQQKKELINYSGNNTSGNISTAVPHKLLLLTGLYASIFQWRKFIFLIIVFIPIIVILGRTLHY